MFNPECLAYSKKLADLRTYKRYDCLTGSSKNQRSRSRPGSYSHTGMSEKKILQNNWVRK